MATQGTIGLDIGSTSVRAVEVVRGKDRPRVTAFGQVSLPDGAVVSGVVRDDRAVTAALKQLWSTTGFTGKRVTLGVTHQQVIVREIDLPNLPPAQLRAALPYQVRDVLPLPVEEAQLDFYPLEDAGRGETVHGLLIGAPKQAILDLVHAVERAGLTVAHVDLACFAALRSSAHLAEDAEAVIDIGANTTHLSIHLDGVPQIVRTIPRGGNDVTKLLAARLELTQADAELLKQRLGLTGDPATASESDAEALQLIEDGMRPLLNELRNSFNFYSSSHRNQPIKRVGLVGGGALLPGIVTLMRRSFGIPVFLSDPMQRVVDTHQEGVTLGRFRSSAAVSIGLTLGAA